ncbi:MAG: hypothetical protein HY669_00015 [Chloroflexi bacterium]|nr:hypothetical protein [Chloroflexota bacterium]
MIDSLPKREADELVEDILNGAEVEAELTWDPIARKSAELYGELVRKGWCKGQGFSYLNDPELPDYDSKTLGGLEARARAMRNTIRQGVKCEIRTTFGDVTETVWVRNFEGSWADPSTIAKNVAELLTCHSALKLAAKRG